ncbi:MAG: YscO family type III secretion system apparatus protein [Desulfamplus sp.]|nr:YscO family type III secretion system apparatus protein [Desulfamplus sp.]
MNAYPLGPLLRLRIFRQDKAMRALQVCEKRLVEARRGVKKAVERHEAFLVWLAREEEARYDRIMETSMTLEDIEDFKIGLLALRARESSYLEDILKAKHQLRECEDALVGAKADLLAAQKGTIKIETHKERWLEVEKLEAQRAEELELEDFRRPEELFPL